MFKFMIYQNSQPRIHDSLKTIIILLQNNFNFEKNLYKIKKVYLLSSLNLDEKIIKFQFCKRKE